LLLILHHFRLRDFGGCITSRLFSSASGAGRRPEQIAVGDLDEGDAVLAERDANAVLLRLDAAFRAISARFSFDRFAARALPPRLPSSAAAPLISGGNSSVSSPVAIRMTLTALPITSAGRFSPLGPLGLSHLAGFPALLTGHRSEIVFVRAASAKAIETVVVPTLAIGLVIL
jgi:hypothetical protein